MPSYRSGLGFSASISRPSQRHCYARAAALDQLLATPGALDLLHEELTGAPCEPCSVTEQLARLKRQAIHLSVTHSAFYGLSLEEIIVLCAYDSPRFAGSPFRDQLRHEPDSQEVWDLCRAWLRERTTSIRHGEELGVPRWALVGHSPAAAGEAARFTVAVAPALRASALDQELPALGAQSGFAHEHYVACTPATALDYVRRAATAGAAVRWDPFALDRRLRTLGLGLLLVEEGQVVMYLPARYHPSRSGLFT